VNKLSGFGNRFYLNTVYLTIQETITAF
jgi:hypothetical protein